jgi:hypothetical protein
MKMFLTFLLVFAMTFSIGNVAIDKINTAFAWEPGDCPSCNAYKCDNNLCACIDACLEPSLVGYYFHVGYWKYITAGVDDQGNPYIVYDDEIHWAHLLMVNSGLHLCKDDCNLWTAKVCRGVQIYDEDRFPWQLPNYEWPEGIPYWAVTAGSDFDPEDLESLTCYGFSYN